MGQEQHQLTASLAERSAEAQKATWVSVVVNLVLTVAQLLVGWFAHSQSLVAHGLHSFSDLLSDFLVIYASRQSAHPADHEHPYGHARMETAATLVLGVSLTLIGGGILWESGMRLQHIDALPAVEWSAFWVAVATVVAKEGLYRYLIRAAERLRSQLMTANALHTRADAASALVVVVGIGGALLGWSFLDLLAAALMGFMILHMGAGLAWGAIKELIDTGLDDAQVEAIRKTLLATPGVRDLHELRTRRMAHQALVDTHVQVDSRISVSEGHRIAESARARVLREHPERAERGVVDPEPRPDLDQDRLARLDVLLGDGGVEGLNCLHETSARLDLRPFRSFLLGDRRGRGNAQRHAAQSKHQSQSNRRNKTHNSYSSRPPAAWLNAQASINA